MRKLTQYEKAEENYSKAQSSISICNILLAELKVDKSQTQNRGLLLPKLLLPTFSGDILEWQEFFESFSVAVDRQSIAEIEEF